MITETPRTDAEIISNAKKHSSEVVCANFARLLERELTESKERCDVYHHDWQKLRDENAKLKAAAAQPNVQKLSHGDGNHPPTCNRSANRPA